MEKRSFVPPAILLGTLLAPLSAKADPNAARPIVVVPVPVPMATTAPTPPTAPAPTYSRGPAYSPTSPTPTSPSTPAPAAATSPRAEANLAAGKTPLEAAVQQVVMLERGGRPIAVGIPLNGDGRILTALSPLTHGNRIVAHYPEGQLVPVKLSHSSRAWDLALLTPLGDARRTGLKASHDPAPPAGTKLHALGYVRDKQLGSSDITLKAKSTLRGGDSARLVEVYELPPTLKAADIGAPLVNDRGEVVAVVARACSANDKAGCTLAPYAAPVTAVRDFLRAAPPRTDPWLGLDVVAFDAGVARGVRVAALAPGGPAASAGLRAGPPGTGDVVVAVDGKPVDDAEAFADAVQNREANTAARLTVLSEGRYREVWLTPFLAAETATLAPARNDRVIRSNPSGTPQAPAPPAPPPNPYR